MNFLFDDGGMKYILSSLIVLGTLFSGSFQLNQHQIIIS